MPKKKRKFRVTDSAPKSNYRRFGGTVGPVAAGFDHYGYPIVRNFRLPTPFVPVPGRRYGANASMIKPLQIAAAGTVPKPGIAKVDVYKTKPAPSVPAAPASLPPQYKFCVQKGAHGYFFRFRDAKTSMHGAEADVISCEPDPTGTMICMVSIPGTNRPVAAPLCTEPGADKERLSPDCCVKILSDSSGQLVCPGSAYDLLIVKIVTYANLNDIQIASIEHPDLPGGGARVPVCEPMDEEADERPCCIDEKTGLVVCPEGLDFPLAGIEIPLQFLEFVDNVDGMRVARLKCGDISDIPPSDRAANPDLDAMYNICEELGGYIFPVCTSDTRPVPKPKPRPKKFPDICCYDPSTGTLVCEGTVFHGLAVEAITETVVNGRRIVSVAHPDLPGGGARVLLCPPRPEIPRVPPAECCVIESSAGLTLMCNPADHPWHGRDVTGAGQCIDTPDGRMCVLKWTDEYGDNLLEVPICPPPPERIPVPSADIPPAPEPVPVPVPPRQPKLPPPSAPPTDGCESEEGSRCRGHWEDMISKPAKLTKCDHKWIKMLKELRSGRGRPSPGRRYSCVAGRRYGTGISPDHLEYARFPGLRGGRRTI